MYFCRRFVPGFYVAAHSGASIGLSRWLTPLPANVYIPKLLTVMKQNFYIRLSAAAFAGALMLSACGKGKGNSDFPENFGSIGDEGRTAFMMKRVGPDSVARFLCDAALGRVEGARIDSLPIATSYAYTNYKDDDLATFSSVFESYSGSLPLADRMKLYVLAGKYNPQQLGYQLGLEYVVNIRNEQMSVDEVTAELKEFRNACGHDKDTYRRFVKGFKVALEAERTKGIDPKVYDRFINLQED